MIKVLYSGVTTNSSGRIWGHLIDSTHTTNSWGSQYYTFWGRVGGKIYFQRSVHNAAFYKMKSKKVKRYEPVKMDEHILNEFGQLKILRKLKGV